MVELFSTTAVAMAGLSMGLIVGSALAGRTSAEKTPLSQGGVGAASNNGLFPVNTPAVCQGLPTTKSITPPFFRNTRGPSASIDGRTAQRSHRWSLTSSWLAAKTFTQPSERS